MAQNVSDFFWQRLHAWGVRRIFGYPGDGIIGLMGGLDRARDKFEFVQARHEEMAAFMACAHAKFTGEVGVCMATSGPGATHLLTGMYDASEDHMPMLAIVGQAARTAIGGHYQQELDLHTTFKDVASAFVETAMAPAQVRHLVDRAMRIAMGERRVTALILPKDVQELEYESPPHKHNTIHSGIGYTRPKMVPYEADLQRAAEVLNAGKKVAMLVGAGAFGATDEVIAVADRLGAGCATALLGKMVLPSDLPWNTECIGLIGTKPSINLMDECDTLFMIGSGFPWAEFLPKQGKARGVQIDTKPAMLSIRFPMEVNLNGDSKDTLKALLPLLTQKTDTSWRASIAKWKKAWEETVVDRALTSANPVNPQRPFHEASKRLPHNAIITADSGTTADWYARDIKVHRGMMGSLSGSLASMGAAVPYAIGAKFAHPDRPVITFVGDGAMQMNNMAELITVSKYWRNWSNPTWICLVLNNADLNQVTWEERTEVGDVRFPETQSIPSVPYHKFAELIGLKGIYVDTAEGCGPAWDAALAADRPCVIEVKSDPDVPPLSPAITLEQARNFMAVLLKGDPEEGGVILETAKQMLSSVLPHHKE